MRKRSRGLRRRGRDESGQALTETLLITMPLIMLFAALFQVFLVDSAVFRLATRSHAEVFRQAFSLNSPNFEYGRSQASWGGSDQYVPIVRFFRPYGLTRANMRIRTLRRFRRTSSKEIEIGRGTAASIAAGVAGGAAAAMNAVNTAMQSLDRANRWRDELEASRNRARR